METKTPGKGHDEGGSPHGHAPHPDDEPDAPRLERLERYVLVVTPRQPMVDWVCGLEASHGASPEGDGFTLDEAQAYHRTAYLVPLSEDAHDVEDWVEDNFDLVFEQELYGFASDRRRWPHRRTLDAFLDWFDLDLLDAPIDLVDAPLVAPAGTRGEGG